MTIDEMIQFVADRAGVTPEDVQWWSWPELFATTSGPGGGFGGAAITEFQVYAFNAYGKRMKYCAGVWRHWNGEVEGRW